jgi:hypothetical protein
MYRQRTTSGAAGNSLHTTTKYMRGASGIAMGIAIKHLRRTTSGAAGNGLGATMKYLRRTTSAAAINCLSDPINRLRRRTLQETLRSRAAQPGAGKKRQRSPRPVRRPAGHAKHEERPTQHDTSILHHHPRKAPAPCVGN